MKERVLNDDKTTRDFPPDDEVQKARRRYIGISILFLLAAALLPAIIDSIGFQTPVSTTEANADLTGSVFYLIGVSLLVAAVEETIFRGLLLSLLTRHFGAMAAVLLTSVVFAALHAIPIGADGAIMSGVDALQVALSLCLKFLQAFFFGIILATMVSCNKNLVAAIIIHAVFDIIYFAPYVLVTGDFPSTYITSDPIDLMCLSISWILMVFPVAFSFKVLKRKMSLDCDRATK